MKKLLLSFAVAALVFSCKNEPKDYATVSGKVTNIDVPADSVVIFNQETNFVKKIKLNEDGTFKDTLKVESGKYTFKIGDEYGTLFLKNNDVINITTDYSKFDENLKFDGSGENVDVNNLVVSAMLFSQNTFSDEAMNKTPEQIQAGKADFEKGVDSLLAKYSNISDSLKNEFKKEMNNSYTGFSEYVAQKQALKNKFIGKPAPTFSMEDINGKKVSSADLKGKPIYVDIWATWCGPCKAEIPSLKKLEEEYGDDIAFVSISVDEPKDKEKWKEFVAEKGLKGYQLTTGSAWNSQFVKDLEVQGIPRFVLIDEQGNILDPDAPRPSSQRINGVLNDLANN
ncbi:TlpA family protein disulfide reductase [Weeksellaceae bacterium TAE3-ERU29]|nr:TlpA family protein disulfide reductase [Weeksellaceae bacterium TAE3-ERU29]